MSRLPRPSRKIGTDEQPPSQGSDTKAVKTAPRFNANMLRPSDTFVFEPHADISAYELACLLKRLYEPAIHFKSFLDLPENLQRHFRPTKS